MHNSDAFASFILAALLAIAPPADAKPEGQLSVRSASQPEGKARALRVDPHVKRLAEAKKGEQVVARSTGPIDSK